MTALTVLIVARGYYEARGGVIDHPRAGVVALDDRGRPASSQAAGIAVLNINGAIARASPPAGPLDVRPDRKAAMRLFQQAIGVSDEHDAAATWCAAHTKADVLAAFDRAIEMAQQ